MISTDLRRRILAAIDSGLGSVRSLAEVFGVGTSSISRWRALDRDMGSVEPKAHAGGRERLISDEQLPTLRAIVEERNDATLPELREAFRKKTRTDVSCSTISRALSRLNLSRKKKTFRASQQDDDEVKRKTAAFFEKIEKVDTKNLIFIDEAGANLGMKREYGRSETGTRANDSRPGGRHENITMVGALGTEGFVTMMTLDGALDGPAFAGFATTMLAPHLRDGHVVVLDNLSVHKNATAIEAIEKAGATTVCLPPYSPELNPIEECWSKVKSNLRSAAARTRRKFDNALRKAMDEVTSSDAAGWFADCGYSA